MPAENTALVIEDDDDVRRLIAIALSSAGLAVREAATSGTGIQAAREHSPDVVVLDYGLPDRNGLDTAAHLREFTDVPILLLTARTDLVSGAHPGITAAMAKPFRVGELRTRVLDMLPSNGTQTDNPD